MANWLTDFVRPKIRAVLKRETPDDLWRKCNSCGQMVFHRELAAAFYVCPNCDFHMRIGPKQRFETLFDGPSWDEVRVPRVPADPLHFRDEKRYPDRLKDARGKTKQDDAITVATGTIEGIKAIVAVQNFAFMGGSLGMGAGEAIVEAARVAVREQAPLIVFTAAGGARMQEGILALMQLPRTTVAIQMVHEAGLPYFVVLTDPTTGGVTASYAMLGDIQIAEPGALIGFAGPRVIEQTIREKLPEGFQRAEYLLEHGMLDMVVHRRDMRTTLARLLYLVLDRKPHHTPALEGPRKRAAAE